MGWVTTKLAKQKRRTFFKRAIILGLIAFFVVDLIYVSSIKPDWDAWKTGDPPKSVYMKEAGEISWTVVPFDSLPEHLSKAVIAAEDARFRTHSGVDFSAIGEAADYFREHREVGFGASTISQQVVKNLVVGGSRSLWRKWHEMILALMMERNLSKDRILYLYLNIVELGPGIFGVEAASKAYWNKSASALTLDQSIELAATLPSPRQHNPKTRTERFVTRCEKIRGFMEQFGWVEKRPDPEAEPAPPETAEPKAEEQPAPEDEPAEQTPEEGQGKQKRRKR